MNNPFSIDVPLANWKKNGTLAAETNERGHLLLRESPDHVAHLWQTSDLRFSEDWLDIHVVVKATSACNQFFYISLFGNGQRVVCSVDKIGQVMDRGVTESLTCQLRDDGCVDLRATYYNVSEWVTIGTTSQESTHQGTDQVQYEVESIQISINRAQQIPDDKLLNYIDVGARGGSTYETKLLRRQVRVIMFEPDPDGAAALQLEAQKYPGTKIVQKGLYSTDDSRTLYLTKGRPCSSLLEPNHGLLKYYKIQEAFKVERQIDIGCTRYDSLYSQGDVPAPDAIKIDVQGVELEVLYGFGKLLAECIGITLETHVYPIYHEQKLLTDITQYLEQFNLMLVKLVPQRNFASDLVEFDAFFLKRTEWMEKQTSLVHEKLKVLKRIWFL